MPDRVNLQTVINSTILDIQLSTFRMQRLQEQIASGKKINRPSDDPSGARKVLSLRSEGLRLEQYSKNIQTSIRSIEFSTSTLHDTTTFIQRVQELTIQGVNGATDQAGRDAIASEINGILEAILQIANSSRMGLYIFAGTETTTMPFEATRNAEGDITAITYKGNREKIKYPVGPGSSTQVNQPGAEVFIDSKIFTTLMAIRDNLAGGALEFARAELDNIKNAHTDILQFVSKGGAIVSALEFSDNRMKDAKVSLEGTLGEVEGADLAELILKLKEQENILQAVLASGVFILNTSILDFM